MKVNCTGCRKELDINAQVVIDEANSLYHADCYSEMKVHESLIEWKDFGAFKNILVKHNI